MSKIDKVMQWIGLVALILSVIGNFVIFGYFDSERSERIALEAMLLNAYSTIDEMSIFVGAPPRMVKMWHKDFTLLDSLPAVPPKDWQLDVDTTIVYDSSEVTESIGTVEDTLLIVDSNSVVME